MNTAGTVAKNTLVNALTGTVIQVLSVLSGLLIARRFGPGIYGELSFAFVIVGYFMIATDFGMTTIAIRKVAQDRGNYSSYLYTYIISRISLSVAVYAILILVVYLVPGFFRVSGLLISTYGLLLITTCLSITWMFVAVQKMEYQGTCDVFEKILYVAFIFAGVLAIGNYYVVPISMIVSSTAAAVLGWFFLKRQYPLKDKTFDKGFFRELLTCSWPIGLSNGASRVNYNMDTIFLQMYHGSIVTGQYSAAYRIIGVLLTLGTFLSAALYPMICEKATGSKETMESLLNQSARIILLLLVFPACVLSAAGNEIMAVLFGSDYESGGTAMAVLSWVPPILLISRLYGNTLTAINRQTTFMIMIIVSALLNIALNFLLIPSFGMIGGGVATIVAETAVLIPAYVILSRIYCPDVIIPALKALAAGGLTLVGMLLLKHFSLLAGIIIAPMIYLGLLFLFKGVSRNDVESATGILRALLGKMGVAARPA